MNAVIVHNVVSVDGFIADAPDQVGPLFDWYTNGTLGEASWSPARIARGDLAAEIAALKDQPGPGRHRLRRCQLRRRAGRAGTNR